MASPPSSRNDFEVAIVCALPTEYNAVVELVDHFWEDYGYEYGRTREDANTYTTARIGNSDVVLVLLSGAGKAIAASSATSLRSSYPGIKLLLLTGICGGVPLVGTEEGILLGDVVISETVIQYDYGRRYPDKFIMKHIVEESLSRPAKGVRNLVALFRTNRALHRLQQRAAFFLEQIQDKPLSEGSTTNYQYPGTANDRLFTANFRHKHHRASDCLCRHWQTGSDPVCEESRTLSCEELGCDEEYPIQRHRLEAKRRLEHEGRNKEAQAPFIFVGRIGSGDIVLKSGEDRDRIAKLHSILAFEMEGAGAWDELPCIVVKGVSDYADSHKNNKWQDFAAATAASTMKALLERYTPIDKPRNIAPSIQGLQAVPGMAYPHQNDNQSRIPVCGVSPHSLPYSDNQLRRKSPRGTITDGYDASTPPTALALPPVKYIRGLPSRENRRSSEFLDDSMPYTPVMTATGLAQSIELEGHAGISDQDNSCFDGFQPTKPHAKDVRFNGAIDPATKQMLVKQLYFSKIDERLTHLTPAQGNTCRWFLSKSEYTDWYNNVEAYDHCGFLWIKGNPGTGKSTLMKFLFENERSNTKNNHMRILLSFFFLARGTAEEKSTVGLYRSLLHQLFEKVPRLIESLDWMTPDGARVIHRDGWSEEALKQTLKHAVKKLGDISLAMYIDALDECEDSQAARMIRFFEELCDPVGIGIRICFSSRHYPHIEITTGTELTLENEDGHKDDITKYVKSNLKLGKRNQQTELLQSEILEKSSRIFLWVVLVVKILTELPDKSIKKMRERLKEIPTELAKLFEMILARDGKNLEQMKLCLNWVLFAIRPLKPQELYFAIQLGLDKASSTYWDKDDIDIDSIKTFVKSSSKGLAEVTRNKACEVQFIHESVREFLLSKDGAQWSGPSLSGNLVGLGHQHLRDCCLAQLNAPITQHVNIPDPLPKPVKTEELRKSITSEFPFLEYSVLSVLQHANDAQHAGIDQQAFLEDFPLQRWVFLNNTIEKYEVRRYTQAVTFLYILAERNLADLIHIHPHLETWLDVGDERYGPPIFAARATGSHQAVQVLLEAQTRTQPAESSVRGLLKRCLETSNNNPTFGRNFTFSRTRDVTDHVIEQGDEVVLKFLDILGKVDVAWKEKSNTNLRMPLAQAAKNGHEGVARFLLEKGAEIESKDNNGRTPLSWAARNGHKAVIKLLQENGAEIDPRIIMVGHHYHGRRGTGMRL
ncbi:hypothetical protein BJY01DRAFT_29180 [Aspergillus pseudoustus]|uniref:Nucleoside phosphorylase domain-containing protein n=1 Tax=Aspergillus pseudoustus TaxID=1810923 RepID=A0ABR4JHP9_9EURO